MWAFECHKLQTLHILKNCLRQWMSDIRNSAICLISCKCTFIYIWSCILYAISIHTERFIKVRLRNYAPILCSISAYFILNINKHMNELFSSQLSKWRVNNIDFIKCTLRLGTDFTYEVLWVFIELKSAMFLKLKK